MTELQKMLLVMFEWFHNFCKENNLTYYAIGGTVLGAIRHQGFIPWDDDMDVGMPRVDYEKLRELVKNKHIEKYLIEFPGENEDFIYPYAKIYNTETTLVEHTRKRIRRGIYIDVFPIDDIGNTYEEASNFCKNVNKKVSFHLLNVCALRKERKLHKNLVILFTRCIPNFIWNRKRLIKDIETISSQYLGKNCKYVANLVGNWYEKEIMQKEWFGNPILQKFENTEIFCPERHDAYLSQLYGDYMKLPPKEKQVSHHDYVFIDLNKSYLE